MFTEENKMRRTYIPIIGWVCAIIILSSGCQLIQEPSSEIDVESNSSSQWSVFDKIRQQNIDVLREEDEDEEKRELFQRFFDVLNDSCYYKVDFLAAVDNKDIYTPCIIYFNHDHHGYCVWRTYSPSGAIPFSFNAIVMPKNTMNRYELIMENADQHTPSLIASVIIENNEVIQIVHEEKDFSKLDISLNDYINNQYLVGSYQDQHGNTYQFTKDHRAIWMNRSFNYLLFTDPHTDSYDSDSYSVFQFIDCNPICVLNSESGKITGEFFGYEIVNEKLLLFNIEFHELYMVYWRPSEEPFAVLYRVENE
jgi:hypothetical protein